MWQYVGPCGTAGTFSWTHFLASFRVNFPAWRYNLIFLPSFLAHSLLSSPTPFLLLPPLSFFSLSAYLPFFSLHFLIPPSSLNISSLSFPSFTLHSFSTSLYASFSPFFHPFRKPLPSPILPTHPLSLWRDIRTVFHAETQWKTWIALHNVQNKDSRSLLERLWSYFCDIDSRDELRLHRWFNCIVVRGHLTLCPLFPSVTGLWPCWGTELKGFIQRNFRPQNLVLSLINTLLVSKMISA